MARRVTVSSGGALFPMEAAPLAADVGATIAVVRASAERWRSANVALLILPLVAGAIVAAAGVAMPQAARSTLVLVLAACSLILLVSIWLTSRAAIGVPQMRVALDPHARTVHDHTMLVRAVGDLRAVLRISMAAVLLTVVSLAVFAAWPRPSAGNAQYVRLTTTTGQVACGVPTSADGVTFTIRTGAVRVTFARDKLATISNVVLRLRNMTLEEESPV